jgi:hypothetical protein
LVACRILILCRQHNASAIKKQKQRQPQGLIIFDRFFSRGNLGLTRAYLLMNLHNLFRLYSLRYYVVTDSHSI